MPLPSSGTLTYSMIKTELNLSGTQSLAQLIQASNLTDKVAPHSISQFYGYTHALVMRPILATSSGVNPNYTATVTWNSEPNVDYYTTQYSKDNGPWIIPKNTGGLSSIYTGLSSGVYKFRANYTTTTGTVSLWSNTIVDLILL